MSLPRVSIITPTVPARREALLRICRPSVLAQTYPHITHIIVQDGLDGDGGYDLEAELKANVPPHLEPVFVRLGRNWRQFSHGASYGAIPRAVGAYMATGDIIGYLDDDDEFLPHHVAAHVEFIQKNALDFSYSQFKRFWSDGRQPDLIGSRIAYGHIGTPCVMHRAECLLVANWGLNGYGEDFALFDAWAKAGLKHQQLINTTIHVHKQV